MPDTAPHIQVMQAMVPGQATAGTDDSWVLFEVPFDATVTAVSYTTDAAITGHASNNRTFSVINTGNAGTGATTIASVTTNTSNNFVAFDEKALTLSGTAANLIVASGNIIKFLSDASGDGVADPGGVVQVTLSRN